MQREKKTEKERKKERKKEWMKEHQQEERKSHVDMKETWKGKSLNKK